MPDLTLRDRIFALLVMAILLGLSSSVAALFALGEASRAGQEAVRLEYQVNQTLGQVAVGHLSQISAMDWAVYEEPSAEASPARLEFEERSAKSWTALQQVRALLGAEQRRSEDGELLASVDRLDAAHNAYAARARDVFAALAQGNRIEARRQATQVGADSQQFQSALQNVLEEAQNGAELHLEELRLEQNRAVILVAVLSLAALAAGGAIIWRSWQLVSRLRSLSGLLPICSSCKSIRDDQGYWNQLELFVENHSEAQFTHGLCEPCVDKMKADVIASRPDPKKAKAESRAETG